MKKFSEYLKESISNYSYVCKLNFMPDNETMNKIEQALAKYELVEITAVKSQPIRRVDKDFPGIENPEVYTFNVSVAYPAPAEFIRNTISNIGLALENVAVLIADHDESVNAEENAIAANTGDKALLDMDYLKDDNQKISDENFGQSYNERLVKNSIGSTDQMIPKELKKEKGKTLNDPEFVPGSKSAMGSVAPNIPKIKSFAR